MQSHKILFVLIFKVSKYALSFIFFYLMVLFYEPNVIGRVQFAIAFVTIFSFIFNLGFSVAHLKIYPEEENKAGCIGTLLFFKGIFILLSLIFYFSILSFFQFDSVLLIIITIFVFEIIIQSINTSMSNTLIADDEVLKGAFPWIVISSSKIVLIIVGLFIFQINEITLSVIYLFSTIFHSILLLVYFLPYKVGKPRKDLIKKYVKFTYPLIFANIALLLSENIGIILINFWISSEAVAFYYAGDHFSVFRTIIPTVISLVMISVFAKNIKEGNSEKNRIIIKKISRYTCILFGAIILLSFLYSDELILILLGTVYEPSIFVFNVLILAQIFVINDIAVYTDLNAKGATKLYSTIKIIGAIYNSILIVFFIAPWGLNLGINGLALAILFSHITYTPAIRLFLWKKYKYGYNFGIFLYLGVAAIVFFINFLFLSSIDLLTFFYLIPILVVINLALYFGILYLVRGIKKEDIKYFKMLINIKSLINMLYKDLAIKSNNSKKNID